MIVYLLGTAVLSEPMRPQPRAGVLESIDAYAGALATASIVIHEPAFGIARLPEGRRKADLNDYLQRLLSTDLEILSYTTAAAQWHAARRADLESNGRKPPFADGQIAAITAVNELTLVTPNQSDFEAFDIPVTMW